MDIQIQLTTKCNERCVFCRKYTWEQKDMSLDVLSQTFVKYPIYKTKYQFSGGEPLCYPHLDILNHMLKGARYKVYTNLACELNVHQKKFLDNAEDISVSFDGALYGVYNKIRRPLKRDAFGWVISNVLNYKDKVRLCMVVTKDNVDEVLNVLRFGAKYKIKTRFYELHTNLETQVDTDYLKKVFESAISEVGSEIYDSNVHLALDKVSKGEWGKPVAFDKCYIKKVHRVIDEEGYEYPCCYAINDNGVDLRGKNSIGNVFETYDIEDTSPSIEYDFCSRCTRYKKSNSLLNQLIKVSYY